MNDEAEGRSQRTRMHSHANQAANDPAKQLDEIRPYLPAGTANAWAKISPVIPKSAYLMGGTALTVHLHHRMSLDLDFFTEDAFDIDGLSQQLSSIGSFVETQVASGTLNGIFRDTKVQFLEASSQTNLEAPKDFAGIRVASLPDIFASKLKVIGDRGAIRDYFDLMVIERDTDLRVEEGLELFVRRYHPRVPDMALAHIVRGLGYLDDVELDPQLPIDLSEVRQYWTRRVRKLHF